MLSKPTALNSSASKKESCSFLSRRQVFQFEYEVNHLGVPSHLPFVFQAVIQYLLVAEDTLRGVRRELGKSLKLEGETAELA